MRSLDALAAVHQAVGPDAVAVAGAGRSTHAALRLWGDSALPLDALGDPGPVGRGLAMALHGTGCRAVVTVEGDGSFLFGMPMLGILAATGGSLVRHLSVVLDNSIYECGGGLPSRTFPLSWSNLVGAFGLPYGEVERADDVAPAVERAWGGVLRLIVRDVTDLPPPDYTSTGAERVAEFRRLLRTRYGVTLGVPAVKF